MLRKIRACAIRSGLKTQILNKRNDFQIHRITNINVTYSHQQWLNQLTCITLVPN